MIPIGLNEKEDHHIPPALLEQDHETGREEQRHMGWNPLCTPESPSPPSSFETLSLRPLLFWLSDLVESRVPCSCSQFNNLRLLVVLMIRPNQHVLRLLKRPNDQRRSFK